MDDRTVLGSDEKSEMRGLVLAGAARADSIRRSRARLAVSVSAVVVVTGIAVGAVTASMYARSGDVVAIPAPAPADSATSGGGEPPSGIAAFARAATDADQLPEGMSGDMATSLRAETVPLRRRVRKSRLLGSRGPGSRLDLHCRLGHRTRGPARRRVRRRGANLDPARLQRGASGTGGHGAGGVDLARREPQREPESVTTVR